jgi:CRISPR-associated protein Csx10
VPLVFEEKKDDASGPRVKGLLRNRLHKEENDNDQYKTRRGEYFAYRHEEKKPVLAFARAAKSTRTHNTVEDIRQKPTVAVGGVYSYEAIAAGTLLKSEILRILQ